MLVVNNSKRLIGAFGVEQQRIGMPRIFKLFTDDGCHFVTGWRHVSSVICIHDIAVDFDLQIKQK